MKYRKLRIAWLVTWGVVAVLVCVMWVRSYWRVDYAEGGLIKGTQVGATSYCGYLLLREFDVPTTLFLTCDFETCSVEEANLISPATLREQTTMGFGVIDECPIVPFWFPALSSTALASAPWIGWSSRFSLRTLLIVTTLVAAGLGLIVYLVR